MALRGTPFRVKGRPMWDGRGERIRTSDLLVPNQAAGENQPPAVIAGRCFPLRRTAEGANTYGLPRRHPCQSSGWLTAALLLALGNDILFGNPRNRNCRLSRELWSTRELSQICHSERLSTSSSGTPLASTPTNGSDKLRGMVCPKSCPFPPASERRKGRL